MGTSYSRSNIGRISLNAGRKLGGAPTVNRSPAYAGCHVLTIAKAPAHAASTILSLSMFTLNPTIVAGCSGAGPFLVPQHKITGRVGSLQCFTRRMVAVSYT